MTFHLFPRAARALTLTLLASACVGALATPVADMKAADLLPMAAEFRKSLNLNANQQTLWQHVEGKSKTILRERQSRREHLQEALKKALAAPQVELRELSGALDAESDTSAREEKQLRQMWLEVNDALDENQRRQVASVLVEQLMRVPDSDQPRAAPRSHEDSGGHPRGTGRGKPGGGMGAPGA
jgi:hypothetical protein